MIYEKYVEDAISKGHKILTKKEWIDFYNQVCKDEIWLKYYGEKLDQEIDIHLKKLDMEHEKCKKKMMTSK